MRIVPENESRVKVGDESGRLTVIGQPFYMRTPSNQRRKFYVCECKCGNFSFHIEKVLFDKSAKSCGCLIREFNVRRNTSHGESKTRLYSIWKGMHKRCKNPNSTIWKWYGAKGIQVCGEWSTFEPFRDWAMSHGYKSHLTIERDENHLGYCPSNCRWITQREQMQNTTRTKKKSRVG